MKVSNVKFADYNGQDNLYFDVDVNLNEMLKGSLIATVPDMPEAVDKVFEFIGAPANEYIN